MGWRRERYSNLHALRIYKVQWLDWTGIIIPYRKRSSRAISTFTPIKLVSLFIQLRTLDDYVCAVILFGQQPCILKYCGHAKAREQVRCVKLLLLLLLYSTEDTRNKFRKPNWPVPSSSWYLPWVNIAFNRERGRDDGAKLGRTQRTIWVIVAACVLWLW